MKRVWLIKLLHYEYWPMWAFYLPLTPLIFIYGLYKRHLFFYTNVNPGIDQFGGFFFDSKNTIDKQIASQYRPKSILVQPFDSEEALQIFLSSMDGQFPLILKPDAGERGKGVVRCDNKDELYEVLSNIKTAYLVQDFVKHRMEYGVFVSYLPNEKIYKVISLTEKKFFTVIGNGQSSIEELIKSQPRGLVFFKQLKERSVYKMTYIPGIGETCMIHAIGNHCNGTEFINRNDEISDALELAINKIMAGMSEIYYGRFDIKVASFNDLINLVDIKILEFNGITAEPIHIYDNSFGYLKSLFSFINNWKYLLKISNYNKLRGFQPVKHVEMLRKFRFRIQ